MDLRELRRQLRVAVYDGDGVAVVPLADEMIAVGALQLVGEALMMAVDQAAPGADSLARRCAAELRERDSAGDVKLAEELEAVLTGGASSRRPVPVDLDDLADALAAGSAGDEPGVLDVETGEVWPPIPDGFEDDLAGGGPGEPDGERTLAIWPEGSGDSYRDMQDFIASIEDPAIADRLSIAIQGKGAFRRFRDLLERWPTEFTRWHAFSDDRRLGRAREWLAEAGYRPAPRPKTEEH